MKKITKAAISLSVASMLAINPVNVFALDITQKDVVYESVESEIVSSGLIYEKKTKLTEYGWVDIHTLKMDLTNDYINLDVLRSGENWGGKDTLSNMANSDDTIVAGINGSFFDMLSNPSDIIGSEYDGDYSSIKQGYNMVDKGAAAIIQTGDDLFVDFFGASIKVYNESGRELFIHAINRVSNFANPVIFNTNAIANTEELDALEPLHKIVIENNVVIDVATPERSVDVPEDGYVIVIHDDIAKYHVDYFSIGTKVMKIIENSLGRDDIELVISGGGKILENGKLVEPGFVVEPDKRHPRSAIGITEDGKYLIAMVIDGRGASIGATHEEMANYLLEYNVASAIHMDGGGSSTLVSRELGHAEATLNNNPSSGYERNIVNGIGFATSAPDGKLVEIKITPSTDKVFKNMPVTLDVVGYDQYYKPVIIDTSEIFWSSQGITGTWKGNVFTPMTPSKGKVIGYYKGLSTSVNITCMDEYIDLDLSPRVLELPKGGKGTFEIIGTSKDGDKGEVNPINVTWTVLDPSIGKFYDGKFVATGKEGITKIILSTGNREISGYVAVGNDTTPVTSFEDISVSALSYPDIATGAAILSDLGAYDGQQGVRLDYNFAVSEVTQATYAVLDKVMIDEPVNMLGLNVYGDNRKHMLKGRIIDANNNSYNVTFASEINWNGWKYVETDIPSGLTYPIQLERVYVATLATDEVSDGSIFFDLLMQNKNYDTSNLKFDVENLIDDPLRSSSSQQDDFKLSVFGSTSGRNRLLDEIVLNKVYDYVGDSDLTLFAGNSDITQSKLQGDSIVWDNKYSVTDYNDVRVITLATNNDGLIKTDVSQWKKISEDLADTVQNNIIIVGNRNPLNPSDFKDQREGQLLHDTLSEFKRISGTKNIFYINANGYDFKIDYLDGIRYIDLNGLWYTTGDSNKIDLDNFYVVDFYIDGHNLNYDVHDLYPKVEIEM